MHPLPWQNRLTTFSTSRVSQVYRLLLMHTPVWFRHLAEVLKRIALSRCLSVTTLDIRDNDEHFLAKFLSSICRGQKIDYLVSSNDVESVSNDVVVSHLDSHLFILLLAK